MPESSPSSRLDQLARAHALTVRYTIELTRLASTHLGRANVGNRDVLVIITLAEAPGPTPSSLALTLGISRSSMSHVLARLQRGGLVTKVTDDRDRRSALLHLTAEGHQRVDAFEAALGRHFTQTSPEALEVVQLLAPDSSRAASTVTPFALARLIGQAGKGYVADATRLLAPYSVTDATERFALTLLRHIGPARPSELAHELGVTYGGFSAVLDRLEAARLIERVHRPDLGDRRTVLVSLTALGAEAAELALACLEEHAEALCEAFALTASVATGAKEERSKQPIPTSTSRTA